MENSNSKIQLASLKLLINFENPSSNPHLKDLENYQRKHRKYLLKCLDFQKNIHLVTLSL
jgi:hypothetical protein